uniref:Ubiquinol-cytochrome c chaperone domain-containing protein n=1 Tax=Coccolithus braarudii TaxID=221442 RepID=A0A7S0LRQ0_9EUKA
MLSRAMVGISRGTAVARCQMLYSIPPAMPLVDKLEELDMLPWWRAAPLRVLGTFSPSQWQRAAGTDMYHVCATQAREPILYSAGEGALVPDTFYGKFILTGLHCWLCHVRLRAEPREEWEHLFKEMMETLWEENLVAMCKGEGLDLIMASKYQKEMQLGWHGMVIALDKALESEEPLEGLREALLRNIYASADGEVPEQASAASLWLAEYCAAQRVHLDSLPAAEVLKGRMRWQPRAGAPPEPPAPDA